MTDELAARRAARSQCSRCRKPLHDALTAAGVNVHPLCATEAEWRRLSAQLTSHDTKTGGAA